jgi:hypothetical protein
MDCSQSVDGPFVRARAPTPVGTRGERAVPTLFDVNVADETQPSPVDAVTARLPYLAPSDEPLRTYAFDPPDGGPRFNGRLVDHTCTIRDARRRPEPCVLDREGFTLCKHPSTLEDFWDEEALRRVHYEEARALVLQHTGARQVLVFDHTLRRRADDRPPLDGMGGSFTPVRTPVGRVHADYTPRSGPERLRACLGDAAAREALQRRYWIVGLWRPLNTKPLLDAPLAILDARSIAADDLVRNELIYRERRGETYALRHNPEHRWYYYPRQTRDEVILFKHFDSDAVVGPSTGAAGHTAFEDPTTPGDAQPRQSVELRALALF